jgi:hypothetical protein
MRNRDLSGYVLFGLVLVGGFIIAFLPLGWKLAGVALAVVAAIDYSLFILQGDLERRLEKIETELARFTDAAKSS